MPPATRRPPAALLPIVLSVALWPAGIRAQTFDLGLVPPDTRVQVVPRPYTVRGNTAEAVTAALRALGLGGYWMRFTPFYIWRYDLEELPLAIVDSPSGRCRFPSFLADVSISIEYPAWERSADAEPWLIGAWDAFIELMERDFEERRDALYAQLRELNRIANRLEVDCPMARTRLDEMMDELWRESWEEEEEARERGERVVLQWPPPGQIRTAQITRPGGIFLVPSATTVELPPTDPAILLQQVRFEQEQADPSGLLVVAGLYRGGQIEYLQKVLDKPRPNGPIDALEPRPYPGLTEVFVATLAGALDSANVLDLAAPIATYLPAIDSLLGRVTLRQLIGHRSGIHNARPDSATGLDWPEAARGLDGRALFTEPGAIYSYSGYNYPLAMWVMESVTRADFPTLASTALFGPLGMARTSIGESVLGLPVTRTTPSDLMIFLSAWVSGELRGAPPLTPDLAQLPAEGRRSFDHGVWYDGLAGVARVSLACSSGAFQIFPATATAFMLWTSGRWPNGVWRYLLSSVGEQQGVREGVLRPIDVQGAGRLGAVDPPCQELTALKENVRTLGTPTPSGDWAGRYRNGDQINLLADQDGLLKVTNGPPLDVSHYQGDIHFVGANGQAFYPLHLTRDTEGRRYLVLDGRAYIHEDDRPAR